MNAVVHAEISVRKRGGKVEDYYPIHHFLDCTKALCSDNRHRILHTLWGVREIIIPIFGHTIINQDGKQVNVKDLCEQDHILPDYQNRFIPTLSDFVKAIDAKENDPKLFESFFSRYKYQAKITRLLLSPLGITGEIKSLLITHNSWFINDILPLVIKDHRPEIKDYVISPDDLFHRMDFKLWMDNGADYPPSAQKIKYLKNISPNND